MLAYMWLLGKSNSTLLEEKKIAFASRQPLFDEKQEKKKHPTKRIKIKKPKPIEE